jgi:hypothetical protein
MIVNLPVIEAVMFASEYQFPAGAGSGAGCILSLTQARDSSHFKETSRRKAARAPREGHRSQRWPIASALKNLAE